MGIFRKYDLTHLAFKDKVPSTYYTCDAYRLEFYDGYESWYYDYTDWDTACDNLYKVYASSSSSDYELEYLSCKLYGLVFD